MDMRDMTIEQKTGQLIAAGFPGPEADGGIKALIRENRVGNIVLFQRNYENAAKLRDTIDELQAIAMEANGAPLFVGVDQEGGLVTRFWNDATVFPGAMALSACKDADNAYQAGRIMGLELRALGVNLNYAPVLDINTNPDNPVINTRSFGDGRERVTERAAAFARGLQENAVATGKHFPGHGDTSQDTHLTMPTLNYDKARLESTELYPFKRLIECGIKSIMTSHIIFPAYDASGLPATLSEPVLTGLLREEMGFEGIVSTDCLEMDAIARNFGTVKAAVMALRAGADLLHICHTRERQINAMHEIMEAVLADPALMKKLDRAVERILRFKAALIPSPPKEEALATVGSPEHKAFALKACRDSLTIYRGKFYTFGADEAFNAVVFDSGRGLTGVESPNNGEKGDIAKSVREAFKNANVITSWAGASPEGAKAALAELKEGLPAVIFTYNAYSFPAQAQAVESLLEDYPEALVIAMRSPYDIRRFNRVKNYAMAYDYTPPVIEALIGALRGEFAPEGVSPVDPVKGLA